LNTKLLYRTTTSGKRSSQSLNNVISKYDYKKPWLIYFLWVINKILIQSRQHNYKRMKWIDQRLVMHIDSWDSRGRRESNHHRCPIYPTWSMRQNWAKLNKTGPRLPHAPHGECNYRSRTYNYNNPQIKGWASTLLNCKSMTYNYNTPLIKGSFLNSFNLV